MNIPAIDRDQLLSEMEVMDIHYMVMPDLDKEDGMMQGGEKECDYCNQRYGYD